MLVGFLVSFAFIRMSARLIRSPRAPWWPGSVVSESGVHLHHLVWGICLMLSAGTLGFAVFGRSPGLAVIAASLMLLVLLGAQPFEIRGGTAVQVAIEVAVAVLVIVLSAICFAKLRLTHGVLGLFFFPIAIYAASRIAKPHSPWARRYYGERKLAKAERRFPPDRRTERLKDSFCDAVGGTISR